MLFKVLPKAKVHLTAARQSTMKTETETEPELEQAEESPTGHGFVAVGKPDLQFSLFNFKPVQV